jgi:hypothetical protein
MIVAATDGGRGFALDRMTPVRHVRWRPPTPR